MDYPTGNLQGEPIYAHNWDPPKIRRNHSRKRLLSQFIHQPIRRQTLCSGLLQYSDVQHLWQHFYLWSLVVEPLCQIKDYTPLWTIWAICWLYNCLRPPKVEANWRTNPGYCINCSKIPTIWLMMLNSKPNQLRLCWSQNAAYSSTDGSMSNEGPPRQDRTFGQYDLLT